MRKIVSILGVIVLFINGMASKVFADTAPKINHYCSLTVDLSQYDIASKGTIEIYHIANMVETSTQELSYQTVEDYQDILKNIADLTVEEQRQLTITLANHKKEKTLIELVEADSQGKYICSNNQLTPGLYLVIPKDIEKYDIDPFLVSLPQYVYENENNKLEYNVVCYPKKITKKQSNLPKTGIKIVNINKIVTLLVIVIIYCLKARKKDCYSQ